MKKINVSPTHQLLNLLDKKLIGYSLAAGAVLAASEAHAVVQYSGIKNYYVPPVNPYTVKFTSGSVTVASEYLKNSATPFGGPYTNAKAYASPLGTNIKNAWGGIATWAWKFNSGQTIGGSQFFNATASYLNPLFNGQGEKFVGVQLTVGPNTHYGWICVDVHPPGSPISLKVVDWAWEMQAGLPIMAGSTVSLSVALTSFTAAMESDAVVLAWTTQSEVDNLGFALERCEMDGEGNVLSDWVEIASYLTHPELEGRGNTSEASEYKISDPNVESGKFYGYRLIDVDAAGNRQVHDVIQVEVVTTLPEGMVLLQNFPNPFNPATTIEFSIPETDNVTLSIYNLKGQTIDVLVNEEMSAGPHHVSWDGSDQPAGVYFYELRTGSHREIRKLMLVK